MLQPPRRPNSSSGQIRSRCGAGRGYGAAMRPKVSACIIVFNEERKIRRCLESVSWCDEIVVLDSFSTDRTPEICREYAHKFDQHEWLGYVGQRNMVRRMASHEWLLYLDSDEEVSPGLRQEIFDAFDHDGGEFKGYEFPRMVFFLGRWIRHGEWYPDVKLRLFHRDFGRTEGIEPHDHVVCTGPVRRLRNAVWHYTYDDIRDQIEQANRFSTITAQQKFIQSSKFRWTDLLFRPPLRFLKGYFLRGGFMDGMHGFVIAVANSYGAFLKYAKIWEMRLRQRKDFDALPEPDGSPRRKRDP